MRSIIFILLATTLACQHSAREANKDVKIKNSCTDSIKHINILLAAIELPDLQQYYKIQQIISQNELIILDNNKHFDGIEEHNKFNTPIQLLSESEIKENEIEAFLEFKELDVSQDTAFVYFEYNIEGIDIEASFYILENCQWHLLDYQLVEH